MNLLYTLICTIGFAAFCYWRGYADGKKAGIDYERSCWRLALRPVDYCVAQRIRDYFKVLR